MFMYAGSIIIKLSHRESNDNGNTKGVEDPPGPDKAPAICEADIRLSLASLTF